MVLVSSPIASSTYSAVGLGILAVGRVWKRTPRPNQTVSFLGLSRAKGSAMSPGGGMGRSSMRTSAAVVMALVTLVAHAADGRAQSNSQSLACLVGTWGWSGSPQRCGSGRIAPPGWRASSEPLLRPSRIPIERSGHGVRCVRLGFRIRDWPWATGPARPVALGAGVALTGCDNPRKIPKCRKATTVGVPWSLSLRSA